MPEVSVCHPLSLCPDWQSQASSYLNMNDCYDLACLALHCCAQRTHCAFLIRADWLLFLKTAWQATECFIQGSKGEWYLTDPWHRAWLILDVFRV